MSLRKKTLLISGAILTTAVLLLYAVSNVIILTSFAELETAEIQEDVERARNALTDAIAALDTTTGDYAHWDDTFAFVQDRNPTYVESNFVDETFINLQLNLVIVVTSAGEIVFAKAFDLDASGEVSVPSELETQLTADHALLNPPDEQTSVSGLTQLGRGPMLVAAHPILTSQFEGPSPGILIFGRALDDSRIAEMAASTQLAMSVAPLDDDAMAGDIAAAVNTFSNSSQVVVQPLNERVIAGYTLLHDVSGSPALALKIEAARDIYLRGQASIRYLALSLLIVTLVSGLGTLVVLERTVLSRLARLIASISQMRDSADLSIRVTIPGNDELARLAEVINQRLEALEETHSALQRLNTELESRVFQRTEDLRRTRDHNEAVINATRDALVVTDLDGKISQANPAFNGLFGYRTDEALGVNLKSLIDDRRTELNRALDSIATGRRSRRREVIARRKDGTMFDADMMLAPIKGEGREIRGIVWSLRDITERVHAEERQSAMIEGMRAVLYSASELIACPDAHTLFLRAVEIGRTKLGLERCAIFLKDGGYLQGTYGTDKAGNTSDEHANRFALDTATWRERLARLQSAGPQWISVEEPLIEWDGEKAVPTGRHGWIAITPIPATEGFAGLMFNDNQMTGAALNPVQQEVVSVFCSLLGNIYERKRLEEDLRQSLAKEKKLNELKSRFSTMISHEFRTPLATIQSSSDLVMRYGAKMADEGKAEHLETIQAQVRRLTTMLDDILTISKAESVGLEFNPRLTDLNALSCDMVKELRLNTGGSHQVVYAGQPTMALIDEKLFRQAISNLLSNAAKYSPEGSTIYVDLACEPDSVVIRVRDEGMGIPEDDQDRLFQIFHRARNVGNISGTGLGLAIARHGVELHGGTIRVESAVGTGTTFVVRLPLIAEGK